MQAQIYCIVYLFSCPPFIPLHSDETQIHLFFSGDLIQTLNTHLLKRNLRESSTGIKFVELGNYFLGSLELMVKTGSDTCFWISARVTEESKLPGSEENLREAWSRVVSITWGAVWKVGVTSGGVFKLCLMLCSFFSAVIIWMLLSWESKEFGVNSGSGLLVLWKVWNYILNSKQPKL